MGSIWRTTRALCSPHHSSRIGRLRMSTQELLKVDIINEKQGVGEICMQKSPVNSLDRAMLAGLVDSISRLERDGCRALLITSGVRGIFSAGLNLLDLYDQQKEDLLQYWGMVQEMFLRLYGTSMLTVACITGAAPAAGCLISTSCDYRLMLDQPKTVIGLNESLVGLPVPDWMRMNFCDVVGRRQTDLALQMGLLFPARDALRIGLVDQVADSPEQLREAALQRVAQFLKVPDEGRVPSKRISTEPLLSYLSGRRQKDAELFVTSLSQESVQAVMGKYLEALRNKKA
ncbi:enoyl-CoA delta isomerase 1, mitochondrial-like isoform X2 [Pollicipes pollicipes]|nr:enoyl-CoA delta isomerase 1, mitochondrial-like isoform X2 [Pollicipes pollicipes]XP_037073704.1 enoyl-CoA delta isomerase 1, mitochondrial-like isoform X2 [Pollicipes pollicipes]XP_037073705.1 enoyl-CoA delta isomerase 1, mitochondrial-like isoform X2 [Pollicipes pollicipes]